MEKPEPFKADTHRNRRDQKLLGERPREMLHDLIVPSLVECSNRRRYLFFRVAGTTILSFRRRMRGWSLPNVLRHTCMISLRGISRHDAYRSACNSTRSLAWLDRQTTVGRGVSPNSDAWPLLRCSNGRCNRQCPPPSCASVNR